MTMIRVLVVDDSPSMRQLIRAVLDATPDIAVVGEAGDPIDARAAVKALNPDVITLDVEMPRMSGVDFLVRLMRLRPTPVIMVSNLTRSGGTATLQALEAGAVDCVSKPRPGDVIPFGDLADKIRIAAVADVAAGPPRQSASQAARAVAPVPTFTSDGRVLAIGSSTGGVEALTAILTTFPDNCPPTVITQHMPPGFTRIFAERLNRLCAPTISEAEDGAPLQVGHVYVAHGDSTRHLEIGGVTQWRCRYRAGPTVNGHCPSVDVLFKSVARAARSRAVGVILTGMGRDGAEGLLAMRTAGATTLGQDARSSLVYGMPKVAFEAGAVERQLPLDGIGAALLSIMSL